MHNLMDGWWYMDGLLYKWNMDVFDRSGWVLLYLNFRLFNFNKMSFREESIQLVAVDSNKSKSKDI